MADVVITMSSDVAKVIRDMEKVAAKNQQQIATLQATVRASKEVDRAMAESSRNAAQGFDTATKAGDRFKSSIVSISPAFQAAMAGVIGTLSAVVAAMQQANAEADQIAENLKGGADGVAGLGAVSASPADFAVNTEQAKALHGEHGIGKDLGEAATFLAEVKAADAEEYANLLADLQAHGVVKSGPEAAQAGRRLQQALGTEETGTLPDLIGKALVVRSESGGATADELLTGAARAGTGARQLGLSDEQLLAATAVTSKYAGGASEGSAQLKALLSSLEQHPDLWEGDFKGTVTELNKLGPDMAHELGSPEAESAAIALGEAMGNGAFDTLTRRIEAEQGTAISQSIRVAQSSPIVRETLDAQKAQAQANLSAEREAMVSLGWQKHFDELRTTVNESDSNSVSKALQRASLTSIETLFPMREWWLENTAGKDVDDVTGRVTRRPMTVESEKQVYDLSERYPDARVRTNEFQQAMDEATAAMRNFARSVPPPMAARPRSVIPANRAQQAVPTE